MSATSETIHRQVELLDEAIQRLRTAGGPAGDLAKLEAEKAYFVRKLQVTQEALNEGRGAQLLKG